MLLIQKSAEPPKREQIKITLDEEIYKEISAYCSTGDITLERFVEQAALFLFKKDREWREFKKQQENKG